MTLKCAEDLIGKKVKYKAERTEIIPNPDWKKYKWWQSYKRIYDWEEEKTVKYYYDTKTAIIKAISCTNSSVSLLTCDYANFYFLILNDKNEFIKISANRCILIEEDKK